MVDDDAQNHFSYFMHLSICKTKHKIHVMVDLYRYIISGYTFKIRVLYFYQSSIDFWIYDGLL